MKVQWSQLAALDRLHVWQHIAADNPLAAVRMDERFSAAADRLAEHPKLGRPGRVAGTRELVVHESYRLVYALDEEAGTPVILTVVHTARQWPPAR